MTEETTVRKNLNIDTDIWNKLEAIADQEKRSPTKQLEVIIEKEYESFKKKG